MTAIAAFPPPIRRYLGGYVARARRLRVLRAIVLAVVLLVSWALVAGMVDRLVALPAWARAAASVCGLLAAIATASWPVGALVRRRIDWVGASEELERRDRSLGQRLVTVTSQLLAPAEVRGSPQMLDALVADVSARVRGSNGGWRVDWGGVARPIAVLIVLIAAAAGLNQVAWLNLPQLIARQLRPFAGIPPVSTTQVDLSPGDVTVKERETVVVRAAVRHATGDGRVPTLYFAAGNEEAFDSVPMAAAATEDAYVFSLPPADRDVRYYVKAGDATTVTRHVRVLRRPAVAEFRVRYVYPAYTGRAALNVHNVDGLIEAPQGTEAVLSVVATEPLASATLKLGGHPLDMAATAEANVRQAHFTITKDQPCHLEMTSDRGVPGRGPATLQVRGVSDRAPLVRLLSPASDLRLGPRDTVPLAYQALDDYGVAGVTIRAQVNANPSVNYAAKVKGDARRVDATFELDLAVLKLKVGDVVSITVAATDRAGLTGTSDVRHVLVSPRSIDVATHLRLAELSQASDAARAWADHLAKAQQELEQARKQDADQSARIARAGRALVNAAESATLVRQSLLRAVMYSASAGMSDALAMAVDGASAHLDTADRVEETLASRRGVDDATAGRLGRVVNAVRELAGQIKTLADGDQAAAVLADRANLKTLPTTAPTDKAALDRRKQMLDRARQEQNATLAALDINPKGGSVDAQLQTRMDAAAKLIAAARPVDFDTAAKRWSSGVRAKEFEPPRLDDRLAAASQAQALRPDAELVAAHDLQLASRAAAALSSPPAPPEGAAVEDEPAARAKVTEGLEQFPAALAALRAEHEVNRRALSAASASEARKVYAANKAVHEAATAARAKMSAWAAGPAATADQVAARAREVEELALAANAATQLREFDKAADLDKRLASTLNKPELADASATPRAIDRLSQAAEKIADDTAAATASGDDPTLLAGAQRQLADDIARAQANLPSSPASPDSTEAQQRATDAIGRTSERLAALPMQLSTAEELAAALADTLARLAKAKTEAGAAPATERDMADRVVSMVQGEADDARRSFNAAVKSFRGGRLADELSEELRPFVPDTSDAVAAIEQDLKVALGELDQALTQASEGGDRSALGRAAQQARDAAAAAQDALRKAQDKVDDRNPLVSARSFARAASDALSAPTPNKRTAVASQQRVNEAIHKAWGAELRRSKGQRLSQVPTYSPLYAPPLPNPWAEADPTRPTAASAADRLLQTLPGLREWGRLRERMTDAAVDAPVRESEPAGYSDALRTYFEVLGKEEAKR